MFMNSIFMNKKEFHKNYFHESRLIKLFQSCSHPTLAIVVILIHYSVDGGGGGGGDRIPGTYIYL